MLDDGDTVLRVVGAVLVLGLVFAGSVVALNFDPPEREGAPDVNWTIERVNGSYVEVAHTDGEPVRTENLVVTVNGIERGTSFTDPVQPGDATIVRADEKSVIRVVWDPGGSEREILASDRL